MNNSWWILAGALAVTGCGTTPVEAGDATGEAASSLETGATATLCAPRPYGPEVASTSATTEPTLYGIQGPLAVRVASDVPNPSWPEMPVTVYRPDDRLAYPVLFYSHAYGGTDHSHVAPLLRRLASNGYNVVFVPYMNTGTRNSQYDTLWNGFVAAAKQYGSRFDLTRVGFIGHSFGGGATPELARRAFADPTHNGLTSAWGSAGRFMFIMAPWFSYPNLKNPTSTNDHYRDLPLDVKTVIQVYADDDTNDHLIAVNDIWNKLPVDLQEKSWQLVKSDGCDGQWLNAGHSTPAGYSGSPPGSWDNGHDLWAVARRIHALAAYALKGSGAVARGIAFPSTQDALGLGSWKACGGRAVVPMEASATTPILSACGGGGDATTQDYVFNFSTAAHCSWSDTGAPTCR